MESEAFATRWLLDEIERQGEEQRDAEASTDQYAEWRRGYSYGYVVALYQAAKHLGVGEAGIWAAAARAALGEPFDPRDLTDGGQDPFDAGSTEE
jgi:hypothetical protein